MKGLRSFILALLVVATLVVPPVVYWVRKGMLEKRMVAALEEGDGPTIRKLLRSWPAPVNVRAVAMRDSIRATLGETPLLWAAGEGDLQSVQICIRKGADVNAADDWLGATALHLAAFKGFSEIVELLIRSGADVNAMDKEGLTPLHGAAVWGREEVLLFLIEKGAGVNATDRRGRTPLTAARESLHYGTKGGDVLQKRIVDTLIRHGAVE
jgi:hypothetical protein